MAYKDLLEQLCQKFNLEMPTLITGQIFHVTFNEEASVEFLGNQAGFFTIKAVLAPPAHMQNKPILKEILKLNLALIKKQKESVMIDPDKDQLILARTADGTSINYDEFETIIEDFLGALGFWRHKLTESSAAISEMT